MIDKPELAWNLQDYLDRSEEPPRRIEASPESCEGLLMSDAELEEYILDAIKTLRILADSASSSYEPVFRAFNADMKFLVLIGRLSDGDYNEITSEDNLRL